MLRTHYYPGVYLPIEFNVFMYDVFELQDASVCLTPQLHSFIITNDIFTKVRHIIIIPSLQYKCSNNSNDMWIVVYALP